MGVNRINIMKGVSLIASFPPFKQPPIFWDWVDAFGVEWAFRPGWVIRDLRVVYDCLRDPQHRTNRPNNTTLERMLDRFRVRLIQEGEQLFVLERQHTPIVFLELIPIGRTDTVRYCPIAVDGWLLYFILPATSSLDGPWCEFVRKILSELRSPEECSFRLYTELPEREIGLHRLWESIGFVYKCTYTNATGLVHLYSWSS